MKEHGWIVFLVIAVMLGLLLYSSTFILDAREIAIVKTFGKASAPIDGATQAGLHWKWPWPVRLVRYDAKTFVFEDAGEEIKTTDNLNVVVSTFCTWRIEDAAKFQRTIETAAEAQERLRDLLRERKKAVVGSYQLSSFVNTDPSLMLMDKMEQKILKDVKATAFEEFGVEVMSVGFMSLTVPETVSKKIIENMQEERNQLAEGYRALGTAVAGAIVGRADRAREQIMAFANTLAENLRAKGTEAGAQYYPTFAENQFFAKFLRRMDFIKEAFSDKTMFLLDPSVDAGIGYFQQDPSPEAEKDSQPDKQR